MCSTDKECRPILDIAFIIDSSGSIGRRNWERVKRFVKALVSKLEVSYYSTRIAAMAYSTDPEVVMRFNDYQGTVEVNQGFDGMKYQRGYTYTDKALQLADSDLFQTSNGMRLSAPKVKSNLFCCCCCCFFIIILLWNHSAAAYFGGDNF